MKPACLILFFFLSASHLLQGKDPVPLQGEDLLKSDIVVVLAHPDDETGMAPTLAHYALGKGKRIAHIYCTRGEGGGNMVGRQWGPALGVLREFELKQCLDLLGIERTYFLGQRDWAYTESAQMTLEAWDRESALEQLVRLFRALRPDIVLTMNPVPRPGQHGHHQAAGILAVEAFHLSAREKAFPDQVRDEGLDPWQPRKLYMTGSPDPYGATIPSTGKLPDGRSVAEIAGQALSHHRSQGFGRMADSPWLARPRSYRLLKSTVGFESAETDLFRGLTSSLPATPPLSPHPQGENVSTKLKWHFVTRPALERFRLWSIQQGVPELGTGLEGDLPVVAGQVVTVYLHAISSQTTFPDPEAIHCLVPEPWLATPQPVERDPASNLLRIPIQVKVPETAREDVTLKVRVPHQKADDPETVFNLTLHPTPLVKVPRLSREEDSGKPDLSFFNSASSLSIPHTQTWQGKVDNAQDSSGIARVAYTMDAMWVVVDVQDQAIVRNIQPNDIRGHWRSDSVEICIDPENGAEHTLRTFKVGIFPFDSSGNVRAARDADADQGPIERTAPGMKLWSEIIPGGYRIITSIPWRHVGIPPKAGQRLAFNVLIYDGDKEDASPGENIGQSRLAWSPRRGVQGRPEDWGRIILE